MTPADKRLQSHRVAAGERDHRLVVQEQLAAGQRAPQVALPDRLVVAVADPVPAAAFGAYSAASARPTSIDRESPASCSASPAEHVRRPGSMDRRRCTVRAASAGSPGMMTANSSPPNRASTWPGPIACAQARVTETSSWSPIPCPRLSLTCLKWSRSSSASDSGWASRPARVMASSSDRSNPRRLSSVVSASVSASSARRISQLTTTATETAELIDSSRHPIGTSVAANAIPAPTSSATTWRTIASQEKKMQSITTKAYIDASASAEAGPASHTAQLVSAVLSRTSSW